VERTGGSPDLARSVADLAEQASAYHRRADARERVIDKLHAEVERLRVGEQGLLLRPVTIDLQRLRDDLLRQAGGLPEVVTRDQVSGLLESFALPVEHVLERCGVQVVRPTVGDAFSPREHRAVDIEPAESADQDATVAQVISDGYHDTSLDRTTTPARVRVWRWTPEQPDNADVEAVQEEKDTNG
jgi:molecular chaperone GrpE